jgi:hypothetical protein
MPQIVAAVLIGAGIAAGVKWIAKEVTKAVHVPPLASEDLSGPEHVSEHARVTPRDLGVLVYDAETGVYRPAGKRAG